MAIWVKSMKFFGVTRVSNFINNRLIRAFHYDMFHGLAERDEKEPPHDTKVYANTESPTNLLISRTARCVPDICQPSRHLVVSERYATRLQSLSHLRVMPVAFKRLVDVDYEKGDMSCFKKWGDVDPRELLRTLPDVPEFHRQIGRYYEVQSYRWCDVVDNFTPLRQIEIVERTPPMDETSIIRLSREILEEYPILAHGTKILSERAFQILADGFDRDFFIIREYDLPA